MFVAGYQGIVQQRTLVQVRVMFQHFAAAAVELFQNCPNPFSAATVVSFRGIPGDETSVGIYDASGGLVAKLRSGKATFAVRTVKWK